MQLEPSPAERVIRRRNRRDPKPRFRADATAQFAFGQGSLDGLVPVDHPVRQVRASVERLDLSAIDAKYSSLGTHGYPPKNTLAVWLYASQVGIHASTALAERMKTDFAFQWLAGGHRMSEGHLRKFRRENREFFCAAVAQTVVLAQKDGILKLDEVAIDSMRLRAEASTAQVRTKKRSTKRLAALEKVDVAALDEDERKAHQAKLCKHRDALARCEEESRPNVVLTNPSAGLMKFPNGASAPGHRMTCSVAGMKQRVVVDVFVDSASTDVRHLGLALGRMRKSLQELGIPLKGVQCVADAGYFTDEDLKAAEENREWADVIVDVPNRARRTDDDGEGLFSADDFTVDNKRVATCPAGTKMDGPYRDGESRTRWNGRGCADCPLKARCTRSAVRSLTLRNGFVERRQAMLEKLQSDEGKARYRKRIATVEPVFSYLQDAMGFRRASSRLEEAVVAEVMLKVLAYNLLRLRTAKKLSRVLMVMTLSEAGELAFEFAVTA